MLRFTSIALLLFFLSTACGNGLVQIEQKDQYGNTIKFTKNPKTNAVQGTWMRFSPENIKLEEAQYEGGTLNGKRILYFENGNPEIIETYVNGNFDGPFQLFYEDGQLKQEGMYKAGEAVDEWKGYYPNGQLKEVVTFANNIENGPFIEYYENGKLKAEGTYLDGDNEDGLLKEYDESGTLVVKKECKRGVCTTIWTLESSDQ